MAVDLYTQGERFAWKAAVFSGRPAATHAEGSRSSSEGGKKSGKGSGGSKSKRAAGREGGRKSSSKS